MSSVLGAAAGTLTIGAKLPPSNHDSSPEVSITTLLKLSRCSRVCTCQSVSTCDVGLLPTPPKVSPTRAKEERGRLEMEMRRPG
jgi:hypothetical protein